MHSKTATRVAHGSKSGLKSIIFCAALFLTSLQLHALSPLLYAGTTDRVVAYVDNIAITLSELDARYAETANVSPGVTKEDVLNTMINRKLMLRGAKKMRLESAAEDQMLKEYIDLKIRAFIRIRDEEMKEFYDKHAADFQGKGFETVRDEIENYLTENELNQRLKSHISELKGKACVQIQLERKREN